MTKLFRGWNTVHAKLLRTILLSFSVGIVVAGGILLVVGNNIAHSNMIDNLNVTGKMIADRSAATIVFFDTDSAASNLALAKNIANIDYLCLYDDLGMLFAEHSNHGDKRSCDEKVEPKTSSDILEYEKVVELHIPVVQNNALLGHLKIMANTMALVKTQWLISGILITSLFVSLLVAYLIGAKMVRSSLVPLNYLYRTSTIIAENPLSDERARKISDDEIGRVVDVFNGMLDNLAKENQALTFSENQFRTLSESAPIGVYMKNEYNEYEYVNSRWSDITGLLDPNSSLYHSHVVPMDRSKYKTAIEATVNSHRPQVVEYKFSNPDRGERVLMEYIAEVDDGIGKPRLIGSLLDVTELKVAQFELEKLAFYDPLTQLPNRRFFRDHLDLAMARAQKEGKKIAIYMSDLDEFKRVNDSLGHDVGDELLVNIAKRLQDSLYDGDVVSRMGGDEFLILLDNIDDPTRLDHASNRMLDALKTEISAGTQTIQVSGSLGIAIYPTDATSAEELLRYADMALYNAKESGGDRVSYYSKELDNKIKEKIDLEHRLRRALENQCLQIYIQPQYDSQKREMCWGEVLVRWIDEDNGFIPPDVFIPLAEETGLIFAVGDFVLESTLAFLHKNEASLKSLGIQGLSVNLSAKQFFSQDFAEQISSKFKQYRVSPGLVEFELTESIVMDDVDSAVTIMEALRRLGCQLSIDDFGTGYSSLSYLKRFPITSLKIDKSFIQDIPTDQNDVEISCAVIAMAHSLGLSVVAEGVETEEQVKLLASRGCEFLQGYFFDRPMPTSDLLKRVGPIEGKEAGLSG